MIKLKKKSRNHSINSNLTIDWKVFLPKNLGQWKYIQIIFNKIMKKNNSRIKNNIINQK